jgi:hypothetical protein
MINTLSKFMTQAENMSVYTGANGPNRAEVLKK